ncbi:MAG TPA: C1 family peptidase [Gemmatimonadaceae bacterium]|nr:C1 family peptidase [Gemmatimonadaceae bacterium]
MSQRILRTRSGRKLVARRDTLDFRDQMYVPTLVEVPPEKKLDDYAKLDIPILDQGQEGACTGFGLATVANYLLYTRNDQPIRHRVSPWMFYDLARRYDEWPGERYEGSSARGAMKGWHKHGVCAEPLWTKRGPAKREDPWLDALGRPIGAYYRVNHRDLAAMHSAITEVGVLYATSDVHAGWDDVGSDGLIRRDKEMLGGHAFAIVAYDSDGFWIQNSWGDDWGRKGFGHIGYDDWLANSTDVWVARLGVPVHLQAAASPATAHANAARGARVRAIHELRSHIISLGNDGQLRPGGTYGTDTAGLDRIVNREIPAAMKGWRAKRVLLYAHGGLVDEESAVQKVANYRSALLEHEVYPLSFIWKTDYFSTLNYILQDALSKRRTEGILDAAKDFMFDRLDDALEPVARLATGKASWDQMKQNALAAAAPPTKACPDGGGLYQFVQALEKLFTRYPSLELHIAGHSAGSIFLGGLVRLLRAHGRPVRTCTLWAPACTMALFEDDYLPAIERAEIERFVLYTLTDRAEQDDNCANIYHKSLLYLVSNAFEEKQRIPMIRNDGTPILGMEKFAARSSALSALFRSERAVWIKAPNDEVEGRPGASGAKHHGDFDDDKPTLLALLNRLTGIQVPPKTLTMRASSEVTRERRMLLDGMATGI